MIPNTLSRESWLKWRAVSHGLTWRVALPQDMDAINHIWKAKGKVIGNDTRPDLLAWPVLITLVAEDAKGRIVDGAYLEGIVEITKLGASRRGFESLIGIAGDLVAFVASRKMRFVHAIFPAWLIEKMGPMLKVAGFGQDDERSHWAARILP